MNPSQGAAPCWTGLISEATTMHFGNLPNTFQYEYDHAGRLLSAVSQRGLEDGIIYDANGNILSLERREITDHTTITDLAMSYDGNRLVEVGNRGTQQPGMFFYDYDESGNMTIDSRKRLQISHNVLNLPMIARDTVGNMTSTMT
ncbi:MAG: hypothetical protein KBS80_02080, partial [Bacteroidales bacterium]|nr:hypothetical protein [Candidatus Cryptobacteroides choladohippi]